MSFYKINYFFSSIDEMNKLVVCFSANKETTFKAYSSTNSTIPITILQYFLAVTTIWHYPVAQQNSKLKKYIFFTSVASNEKFKPNNKLASMMMVAPITFMVTKNMMTSSLTNNETEKMLTNQDLNMTMNKFINFPLSMILLFLMVYLLMALIATVKITEFKHGPIRQMN